LNGYALNCIFGLLLIVVGGVLWKFGSMKVVEQTVIQNPKHTTTGRVRIFGEYICVVGVSILTDVLFYGFFTGFSGRFSVA